MGAVAELREIVMPVSAVDFKEIWVAVIDAMDGLWRGTSDALEVEEMVQLQKCKITLPASAAEHLELAAKVEIKRRSLNHIHRCSEQHHVWGSHLSMDSHNRSSEEVDLDLSESEFHESSCASDAIAAATGSGSLNPGGGQGAGGCAIA